MDDIEATLKTIETEFDDDGVPITITATFEAKKDVLPYFKKLKVIVPEVIETGDYTISIKKSKTKQLKLI